MRPFDLRRHRLRALDGAFPSCRGMCMIRVGACSSPAPAGGRYSLKTSCIARPAPPDPCNAVDEPIHHLIVGVRASRASAEHLARTRHRSLGPLAAADFHQCFAPLRFLRDPRERRSPSAIAADQHQLAHALRKPRRIGHRDEHAVRRSPIGRTVSRPASSTTAPKSPSMDSKVERSRVRAPTVRTPRMSVRIKRVLERLHSVSSGARTDWSGPSRIW